MIGSCRFSSIWNRTAACLGILSAFSISFCCASDILASENEKDSEAEKACEFNNAPGGAVKTKVLSSGVKAVMQYVPNMSSACVSLSVRAGSEKDSAGKLGRSHFLEHMLFRRTNKFPGGSLAVRLENSGSRRGAFTDAESINFWEIVPDDSLHLALNIEADRLSGLVFTNQELELERSILLKEAKELFKDPFRLTELYFIKSFYPDKKGGRLVPDGTVSDLKTINAEDLCSFYKSEFTPDKACISVISSVPFEAMEKRLEISFGQKLLNDRASWNKNFKPSKGSSAVKADGGAASEYIITNDLIERAFINRKEACAAAAWPADNLSAREYAALMVLDACMTSGTQSYASKLIKKLTNSKIKVIGDADPFDSIFTVFLQPVSGASSKEGEGVLGALIDFDVRLIGAYDFECAKEKALAQFYKNWQNSAERGELMNSASRRGFFNSLENFPSLIEEVSLEDAALLWDKLKSRGYHAYLSESKGLYGASAVLPKAQRIFVSDGDKPENTQRSAADKKQDAVRYFDLGNGVKVSVWKDSSLPITAVHGFIMGGNLLDPKDNPGLTKTASRLVGTGTLNYRSDEFIKILEDNSINLSFLPQDDGIVIKGWCLKNRLSELVKLLAESLKNPNPSLSDTSKMLARREESIKNFASKDWNRAYEILTASIFPSHPWALRLEKPCTGDPAVSFSELKSQLNAVLDPELTTLSFAGDVDFELFKSLCDENLGDWQKREEQPEIIPDSDNNDAFEDAEIEDSLETVTESGTESDSEENVKNLESPKNNDSAEASEAVKNLNNQKTDASEETEAVKHEASAEKKSYAMSLKGVKRASKNKAYIKGRDKYTLILAGQSGPVPFDKEYPAYRVLLQILGGGSSSRLAVRTVHSEKLGNLASAVCVPSVGGSLWTAAMRVEAKNADRAAAVLKQELKRLAESGPEAAELKRAVSACKGRLKVRLQDPMIKAEWQWLNLVNTEKISNPEVYIKTYDKVTAADVKKAAQKWCSDKDLQLVFVVPENASSGK